MVHRLAIGVRSMMNAKVATVGPIPAAQMWYAQWTKTTMVDLLQCCSESCQGECQNCATGTCLANTNAVCDFDNPLHCSDVLAGWSDAACERFNGTAPKRCNSLGLCSDISSLCGAEGLPRVGAFECIDAACKRVCLEFGLVQLIKPTDVCRVDLTTVECPDIPCSQYIAGWSANVS